MKKKRHKDWTMSKEVATMPTQLDVASSLPVPFGERDDLTVIDGIDSVTEMALNSIGIRKLSEFAGYTPEILAQALQKRTGLAVTADAIARQNWIVSAALLAGASASAVAVEIDDEASEEISAMHMQDQSGSSSTPSASAMAETILQDVTQENTVEKAIVPTADHHLEQSKADAGSEEMVLHIQSVRFEPFEVPATDGAFLLTGLRSEINCELVGQDAPGSMGEEIFICAQIYAVNTATGGCTLLVFQSEHLQPGRTDYRFCLEFEAPEIGSYQLQVVAFLLEPVAKVAFYRGPSLRVIA